MNLLGLSAAAARTLDRRTQFNDVLGVLEWATFNYRSIDRLIDDSTHSIVHNEECLSRIAANNGSVVFAPLHMGAYVLAMANLINRHFRQRRVLILRFHEQNEADEIVLRRVTELGCEVRFMNVRRTETFVDALRFARRSCVVICFIDLPESYGAPANVELFGKRAKLALGIEQLARALNATIVPISVHSFLTKDVINISQAFEVGSGAQDDRAAVSERISRHVHHSVVEGPEHWHMWPFISEYMNDDELTAESSLPRNP